MPAIDAKLRGEVARILLDHGYERREEPFRLSSGQLSHDYVDGKRALSSGERLRRAAEAVVAAAGQTGASFDAVGGLTMGADPLAHAIAVLTGCAWFSVRKARKGHGRRRLVEGARLKEGARALVVEDIVTTGESMLRAIEGVEESGASVVLALALCDRGTIAAERIEARGVRYRALCTYEDLGIEPIVGAGS